MYKISRVLFLLFISLNVWSTNVDVARNYLTLFDRATFEQTPANTKLLKHLGEKVHSFLGKQGKSFLNSKTGQELLKREKKLNNFLSLQEIFKECISNPENKRQLDLRIIDAVGKSQIISTNCNELLGLNKSVSTQVKNFVNITLESLKPEFFNQFLDNNTRNSILAYTRLHYRMTNEPASAKDITKYLCRESGAIFKDETCSDGQRKEINTLAAQMLKQLKADTKHPRLAADEIKERLNTSIGHLNTSLKDVNSKIKVKKGKVNIWGWDSSDPEFDEVASNSFNNYQKQYLNTIGDIPGQLLTTDFMKDKVGSLRGQLDNDENDSLNEISDSDKNTTRYEFKDHGQISSSEDISESIKEMKSKIRKQLHITNGISRDYSSAKPADKKGVMNENLVNFIKNNPFSAGQILLNNPQYAPLVCEQINAVDRADKRKASIDTAMEIGGAVVGVGLMASGVGIGIGSYLLRRAAVSAATRAGLSVAASTAAGNAAVTSSVGLANAVIASAGAGIGLSVVEGTHFSTSANDARDEQEKMEIAFMSGLGDAKNIRDARKELENYRKYMTELYITAPLAPLDLLGIGASYHLIMGVNAARKANKVSKLKSINKTLKGILESPILQRAFVKLAKLLGNDNALKLLGDASQLSILDMRNHIKAINKMIKKIGRDNMLKLMAGLDTLPSDARFAIVKKLIDAKPNAKNFEKVLAENVKSKVNLSKIKKGMKGLKQPEKLPLRLRVKEAVSLKNQEISAKLKKVFPNNILKKKMKDYMVNNEFSHLYKEHTDPTSREYVTAIIALMKKKFKKLTDKDIRKKVDKDTKACSLKK